MGDNARWTAAAITMERSGKIVMCGGSGDGQRWHDWRQDGKAIAMGDETAVAQLMAQWAADNCRRMRGQRWEQCLVFGWSVCCEIWAGRQKIFPGTNVYIQRKYILFSQAK
jgi:hypothetical protein